MPIPLFEPPEPFPASVDTNPAGLIFLIKLFFSSATYNVPDTSTVILYGLLKVAAVPCPSAAPIAPVPANVVTLPAGVITLIKLFPASATYTLPKLSTATPVGELKDAFTLAPLVDPL